MDKVHPEYCHISANLQVELKPRVAMGIQNTQLMVSRMIHSRGCNLYLESSQNFQILVVHAIAVARGTSHQNLYAGQDSQHI